MRRFAAVVLCLLPWSLAAARETPPLLAGLATVDLTPAAPVPLAGYPDRFGKVSTGVHDPVEARAMVLSEGERKLAVVSVDLVAVPAEMKTAVLEAVRGRGFSRDDLLLAATHTHSGPGGLTTAPLFRPSIGPYDASRFGETAKRIAEALARADDARRPARMSRWVVPARGLTTGAERGALLAVLRLDDPRGGVRGLVVLLGAHPTILGADNLLVSADWPGALCAALEDRFAGATALFLNGALGGVFPASGPARDFGAVASYARTVADVAAAAAEEAEPSGRGGAPFESTSFDVDMPPTVASRGLGLGDEPALLPQKRARAEFQLLRLDDLEILAVPGEPTPETSTRLLDALSDDGRGPFEPLGPLLQVVVSCANGYLGGLASPGDLPHGEEEALPEVFDGGVPSCVGDAWARARGRTPGGRWGDLARGRPRGRPGAEIEPGVYRVAPGLDHGCTLRAPIRDLLAATERGLTARAEREGRLDALAPTARAAGLEPKDLVIPALVTEARRLQERSWGAWYEMEGVAEGADVPYDAILLENVFLTLGAQQGPSASLRTPARPTNAAFMGPATTLGQAVLATTLDGGVPSVLRGREVTLVVEPPQGHPFVSITWPGMVGTLRAMGAQGIAVTEEPVAAAGDAAAAGRPIGFLLRDVVQYADDLDDAVRWLDRSVGTYGCHVTVVDGRRRDARTIEMTGKHRQVRRPVDGVLWGCDETDAAAFDTPIDARVPRGDPSSRERYENARGVFASQAGRIDARRAMAAFAGPQGLAGPDTLFAAVFEPQIGRFRSTLDAVVLRGVGPPPHRLLDLLTPEARVPYQPPPAVHVVGDVTEGAPVRLGPVTRTTVTFDSPRPSGVARNDRVEAALYWPTSGEVAGTVVLLPAWKERNLLGEALVAVALATQGIGVLLFPLPWQGYRAPDGVRSGEWTFSADLARTREAWMQGVAEVARASLYLDRVRDVPFERQGVMGISLGGHVAAVAYGAYPDLFRAGVFLLTGGDLGLLLATAGPKLPELGRRLEETGVTAEDIEDLMGPLDPAAWASPARRDDVLLLGAQADEIVPPAHIEALAKAYGGARILWFPGGHYDVLPQAPRILGDVVAHLKARFGAH